MTLLVCGVIMFHRLGEFSCWLKGAPMNRLWAHLVDHSIVHGHNFKCIVTTGFQSCYLHYWYKTARTREYM